ncbi:hypothetical protein B0H34DRAFT_859425 [Crassisporium funariophilum]|nr:hypothetical protein B0H34DRAFT_859425 [Crassisporium funariophilum]
MSSFHRVKNFLKKGKEKAALLTTRIRRFFSPKPSSEVAESLSIDLAYPNPRMSSAVIEKSVDPLQSGHMESLMIVDDNTGAVVIRGLGAAELFANVAEGPSTMPMIVDRFSTEAAPMIVDGFSPEAAPRAVAQAPLAATASPSTDSVVLSGAEFVLASEQAASLHAPHAFGPVNLGPFAGSQNVMVINSTFTVANTVSMGQHPCNLVSQKPNSSTLFTGRREILEQLKCHFAPHVDKKRQMFLLYGMGGIGKTQICLKFAEEMSELISKVFWIDASSTDTIALSLKGISGNADTLFTLQQIAALQDEWLLVFDNADGGPEVVEKFLPPGSKGNILITSRNLALQRITSAENSLSLPEMAKEDAVILLQKSSCLVSLVKDQPELAEKIVSELCCLPLAIDQAGAAIHSGLCDVHKYLEHLSKQRQRLMSNSLFRGASQYDRTVYGTFELSYSEIEARATRPNPDLAKAAQTAILILQTCAFYHYDNISKDIFKHAAERSRVQDVEEEIRLGLPLAITSLDYRLLPVDDDGYWDELFFNQGLQVLLAFSLIKRDLSSNVFSMHPLVHYWSQDRMSKSEKQQSCQMGRIILSCAISIWSTTEHCAQRHRLVPHVKVNYQYGTQIGLEQTFKDDEYDKFSMVFSESGDWKMAEALYLELVCKRKETFGLENQKTLSSMAHLAEAYRHQGHLQKAEKLHVQVFETSKKVLGLEHPSTWYCMTNMASIYLHWGHFQKAEELDAQVFESRKKVLGLEHPDTLQSMGFLALTYQKQGHLQKAEKLHVQVFETTKKILGLEHPHTLTSMQFLASTYLSQGHFQKAEELQIQVLKTRKKDLGLEHPDTMASLRVLALTYLSQGHLQKAEELQVQITEIAKKVLGLEHPDTLTSLGSLASTFLKKGHLKKAEEMQIQVLETRKKDLGLEHPDTMASLGSLALTYLSQGHWQKAEELQVQITETAKKVLGLEHPDTLSSLGSLASTYFKRGHLKKAEELQIQVLETRKKILGLEHPDTLTNMNNLALTYTIQGHLRKAEELYDQVFEADKKVLGLEHPDTLTGMSNLASLFSIQGHLKKAEELQIQVFETSKKILGLEHPDTLESLDSLASTYLNQGHLRKAEELQIQVFETRKKILGLEHLRTLISMDSLSSTYRSQGNLQKAEQLQVQVFETREKILGLEHPDTLQSMAFLALTYQKQGHLQKAEKLNVQVFEARKKVFGLEHVDTLTSMDNLASTYSSQRHFQKAEELQVQVFETRKKILGLEHPDTLTNMNNLALTYTIQGHVRKAEELYDQVFEAKKKVLGLEHPVTLTGMSNLASLFSIQGHLKKAEELHIQVFETRKKILGLEHPHTLTGMSNLATTFLDQGHLQKAEELHVQVFETRKKILGLENPETLKSINNLARIYRNQEHLQKAEELQVQVFETTKKILGLEHPYTLTIMSNLAHTLKLQSYNTEAIHLMKETNASTGTMGLNKDTASKPTDDILPRSPLGDITQAQNSEGCTDNVTMLDCNKNNPQAIDDMDLGESMSIVPPDVEMELPSKEEFQNSQRHAEETPRNLEERAPVTAFTDAEKAAEELDTIEDQAQAAYEEYQIVVKLAQMADTRALAALTAAKSAKALYESTPILRYREQQLLRQDKAPLALSPKSFAGLILVDDKSEEPVSLDEIGDKGCDEEANKEDEPSNNFLPPEKLAAAAALSDIKELLKTKRDVKGQRYTDSGFNNLTKHCLEGMKSFLWCYIDPTNVQSWVETSLKVAQMAKHGPYYAAQMDKNLHQ